MKYTMKDKKEGSSEKKEKKNDIKMEESQKQKNQPISSEKISVRTMDSDIEAIQKSGGEATFSQSFVSLEKKIGESQPEPDFKDIPGYIGPEKPIFSSIGTGVVPSGKSLPGKTKKWKFALIIIGILAIIIGFGFLGYFVIFPYLFF